MDFEKLGEFYLGREVEAGEDTERLAMYDARDLTTHAVCIGMTGSGKTGLCIDLLEEAALDRVPAIIIDPKGDITNLLLTFPELAPEDFRPWVDPDAARRRDLDLDTFAAEQAERWREGLSEWGQDGDRIRALRATADFAVYTPGSESGIPVSVVSSFAAPGADWERDGEYLLERIEGIVSGLLGLIGIEPDPVQSREHILLSRIFEHYWRIEEDLDLSTLILSIQAPPVRKLGVFDVDTFFPEKERMALAMKLNNLIAAPGFQAWTRGQPLDAAGFLATPDGRPRHSIFYLAHLSDAERMFFVTMLLGSVITWMRGQSGTTSLRALLYMDEIYGFLPPVAQPPSKRPFLTLLKQARAYGLGVVLTSQNPVDLDYKALTNAGTWFIGRLQTERDKARLLAGLTTAGATGGAPDLADVISGLDKRVFLLHNVHEKEAITFRTRWAMSYLRGPLTRDQVAVLMAGRERDEPEGRAGEPDPSAPDLATSGATDGSADGLAGTGGVPPVVSSGVERAFLPLSVSQAAAALAVERRLGRSVEVLDSALVYRPAAFGSGSVHFLHRKSNTETDQGFALLAGLDRRGDPDWQGAVAVSPEWSVAPPDEGRFDELPEGLNEVKEFAAAEKELADFLYRDRRLSLLHAPEVDRFSAPGESEREFRGRLTQAAREERDEAVDHLAARYGKRIGTLDERIRRARSTLGKRESEASARRGETMVSLVETGLGMLMGRRSRRAASSSLSKWRMGTSARQRAEEAEDDLEALEAQRLDLERELEAETASIRQRWETASLKLDPVTIAPRRTDVEIDFVGIGWAPYWRLSCRVGEERRVESVPAFRKEESPAQG